MVQLVGRTTCSQETEGLSPSRAPLHSNLGQVVHTCVPLSPSSIIGTGLMAVMPCGWDGDYKPGRKYCQSELTERWVDESYQLLSDCLETTINIDLIEAKCK